MKIQQSSLDAEKPVVHLHPLAFMKTYDDGHKAVFQAKVGNFKVPDEPVLELTVTMASSHGDEKAAREINAFLNEMRAGVVLTAPKPDDDRDENQKPERFNVDKDILFDAQLIRPDISKGPVDVRMVIQTTVEGYTRLEQVPIALATGVLRVLAWFVRLRVQPFRVAYLKGSVLKGLDHQYTSRTGSKIGARVTSTFGSARIFPGAQKIKKSGFYDVTAKTITVHGISKKCRYRIRGDFRKLY